MNGHIRFMFSSYFLVPIAEEPIGSLCGHSQEEREHGRRNENHHQ